jgi:RimJ/RimL family protein N-acetyltransferase
MKKINNILLRNVQESDLPIFFEHQRDPVANQMAAFPARDKDAFMAHWTKIMKDESVLLRTILFESQVAGNIVSFEMSGEREVGYWLGREFWGKGIATQALSAFLAQENTRPLYAHVAKHNVASQHVLEKCGFVVFGKDKGLPNARGEKIEELILKIN